jgi:Flp pilus assembly pilin Flp
MKTLGRLMELFDETVGQDFVDYALIAGFFALVAVAIIPAVANHVSIIFRTLNSPFLQAAASHR